MTINKDAGSEAEFTALLAELEAEQAGDPGEEAAPEADSVEGDPEADEESEEAEDLEEGSEDDEELEPEAQTDDIDVEDVLDLIRSGDLTAGGRLDASIFKLNNRQFTAMRKGLSDSAKAKAEADAARAEGTKAKAEADRLMESAQEAYGPIVAGAKAGRDGDWTKAAAAIELMFGGVAFQEIVGNIARAAKGIDPAQAEVIKLRRELEAEKATKAKEQETATAAAAQKAEETRVLSKLKGTPLEGMEDAAAEIAKLVRESYDSRTGQYSVSVKDAYGKVKEAKTKEAERLAKLRKTQDKTAPTKEKREPLKPVRTAPRRVAAKKLTAEEEFQHELALAKRETDAAERRIRRSK